MRKELAFNNGITTISLPSTIFKKIKTQLILIRLTLKNSVI